MATPRHPHVFGDAVVGTAREVKENWHAIKEQEVETGPGALTRLDGVAEFSGSGQGAAAHMRARTRGFDWEGPSPGDGRRSRKRWQS